MNTEVFRKSWNLSSISAHSSLRISAYMWNISTWSTKYLVSHRFKWWTWPGRGQNSIAFCGGGALGSTFSFLSDSGRSASVESLSWSCSVYSAGSMSSIGRNVCVSHRKVGESTQVSSGYSFYHWPETSLQSSASPNTNVKHAICHLWNLYDPEAPWEVYLSTSIFSLACSSSVHLRSLRCALCFGIGTSGVPSASFDSNHLLIIQGFAICIIWYTAFCWPCWSSVQIACIKIFTVEYNVSALCFSRLYHPLDHQAHLHAATSSDNSGHGENGILV